MASNDTKNLDFANFDPVLRSLGGHINWFTSEYNTKSLLNIKKDFLDSPNIKVKKIYLPLTDLIRLTFKIIILPFKIS